MPADPLVDTRAPENPEGSRLGQGEIVAGTRSQTIDFVGRQPKIWYSGNVRWNQKKLRLERQAYLGNQAGKPIWLEFEPLPNLAGLRISKHEPRPKIYITAIANNARDAANVPAPRRKVDHLMSVALWNIVWRCIKRRRPALAEALQDDFVKNVRATFDATIEIDQEQLK